MHASYRINSLGSFGFFLVSPLYLLSLVTKFVKLSLKFALTQKIFLLSQMVTPAHVQVGADGWARSTCLHRGGFPSLLWDTLQEFGYVEPPEYVGREYIELGFHCCEVVLDIPSTPAHPGWAPWRVVAHGHKLTDTWEIAAFEALTKFCEKHPEEIVGTPAAFFPIRYQSDPQWAARIMDLDATTPVGALLASTVSYNIALFNLFERREAQNRLFFDRARDYRIQIDRKNEQIQELNQKLSDKAQYIEHLKEKLKEAKIKIAKLKEAKLKQPKQQIHDLQS